MSRSADHRLPTSRLERLIHGLTALAFLASYAFCVVEDVHGSSHLGHERGHVHLEDDVHTHGHGGAHDHDHDHPHHAGHPRTPSGDPELHSGDSHTHSHVHFAGSAKFPSTGSIIPAAARALGAFRESGPTRIVASLRESPGGVDGRTAHPARGPPRQT